jgi:hypothetical protein
MAAATVPSNMTSDSNPGLWDSPTGALPIEPRHPNQMQPVHLPLSKSKKRNVYIKKDKNKTGMTVLYELVRLLNINFCPKKYFHGMVLPYRLRYMYVKSRDCTLHTLSLGYLRCQG